MSWALVEPAVVAGEEAEIVERAEALQRLEAEDRGVAAHRVGEVGLDVPRVHDDDVVRPESVDGGAEAVLDRGKVPGGVVECEGVSGERRVSATLPSPQESYQAWKWRTS